MKLPFNFFLISNHLPGTASAFFISSTGKIALFFFFILAGVMAYRSKKFLWKKSREETEEDLEDPAETEGVEKIMKKCKTHLNETLMQTENLFTLGLSGFIAEDLTEMKNCINLKTELTDNLEKVKNKVFRTASVFDSSAYSGHYYVELKDYQFRMIAAVSLLLTPLYEHLSNSHKPFVKSQKEELTRLEKEVSRFFTLSRSIIQNNKFNEIENLAKLHNTITEMLENMEVAQIKRIKTKQVNTRNSVLFLNTLSETKNMLNQNESLVKSYKNLTTVLTTKN